MMQRQRTTGTRRHPVFAVAMTMTTTLVLGACSGGGGLGEVLGGVLGGQSPSEGTLVAEIQDVDSRDRTVEIRTNDGQRGDIVYDEQTQVVYEGEQYPVSALERGDIVEMRVQETTSGALYTGYILVRQSVQERDGDYNDGRLVRVSGEVSDIDYDGGRFEVNTNEGRFIVTLPYNPPGATVYTFQRLERGDYVEFEGYLLTDDRVELVRFID